MSLLVPAVCGFGVAAGLVAFVVALWGYPHSARRPEVRARIERLVNAHATVRVAVALLVGLATLVVTRWAVGAAFAVFGALTLPEIFAGKKQRTARVARTEAIASWSEMLRDTLAGAAGLEQTIAATAPVAPIAIRREVSVLARRLERHPLVPSLRAFADELCDPTADLIVSALILATEHQAKDLGAVLGTLATSARSQAAMQLRVEAGRARTRSAVQIITVFTLVFAAGMVLLNRGYLATFDSLVGQCVLAFVGGCFAVSFWLMDRMSAMGEPARVLVRSPSPERA